MPRSSQIALASPAKGAGECLSAEHERNDRGSVVADRRLYLESEWTMSRRPNRRESSEKAPGPKRKRAAVTQNEKAK
jgi:hypothetical protein